jgi:glycosyltransferase involved in cell wall biosynthesis
MITSTRDAADSMAVQPDVSVVLPVFWRKASVGAVRDLRRALDSVLAQSYPGALEVLVVDDGSPAPVADALARTPYGTDPRLRIVRMRRNGGLVHALNAGLAVARHDLVARLDADDAWRPDKIRKQVELFARDPDLTIAAAGMRLVHRGLGTDVDHVRPGDWEGILRFFVTVGSPFPHGTVLARRDVYLLLGGYSHDPRFAHCEDYALWGTWLRFFKPAMLEEVLLDYTVSSASVSGRHSREQRTASGVVQQTFIDLGDHRRIPAALRDLADVLGVSVLKAGVFALRAWRYRPSLRLPADAVPPLRVLLPDRRVVRSATQPARRGEALVDIF